MFWTPSRALREYQSAIVDLTLVHFTSYKQGKATQHTQSQNRHLSHLPAVHTALRVCTHTYRDLYSDMTRVIDRLIAKWAESALYASAIDREDVAVPICGEAMAMLWTTVCTGEGSLGWIICQSKQGQSLEYRYSCIYTVVYVETVFLI